MILWGIPTPPHRPEKKRAPYGNWGGYFEKTEVYKSYATCWTPSVGILSLEMAISSLFMIFGFSPPRNISKLGPRSFLLAPILQNSSFYFRYLHFPTTIQLTKNFITSPPPNCFFCSIWQSGGFWYDRSVWKHHTQLVGPVFWKFLSREIAFSSLFMICSFLRHRIPSKWVPDPSFSTPSSNILWLVSLHNYMVIGILLPICYGITSLWYWPYLWMVIIRTSSSIILNY